MKAKFGLAVVVAAFLVLNPAGKCARAAHSIAPSHPCHKTPAPPPEDCGKAACVYMNALPLATAASVDTDSRQVLAVPVIHKPVAEEFHAMSSPAVRSVELALRHRFLTIHQLLI